MTIGDAKEIIMKEYKDGKITLSMESNNNFIFEIVPRSAKRTDSMVDSLYSVNKKTKKVDTYQPWEDPEDYKSAVIVD